MCQRGFQREAVEKLREGESVLIVAPTGLGKTRAALQPFTTQLDRGGLLGTRLLYCLPLRALVGGVVAEFQQLCSDIIPVVHHGDEPESEFFSERAIVTTVDQYFTAFAGAPLSWASHLSHAAAGAVLTSYSVFDEVHLLSPRTGLHLLFAILRLRQRWGLLSCVMTATLPVSVVKFFQDFCGLKKVEATQGDIDQRDSWRKVQLQLVGQRVLPPAKKSKRKSPEKSFQWDEKDPTELAQLVQVRWEGWKDLGLDGPKKVIVFVNTVDRAIEVYRKIRRANFCSKVLLAHSRFAKEDRKSVEDNLLSQFGKNTSSEEAILITTQVAEAGLNISAPLVITELCPMDSLIQRIGRCQRFKPDNGNEQKGIVLVVKPKAKEKDQWYPPYLDSVRLQKKVGKKWEYSKPIPIAEITRQTLELQIDDSSTINLDWNMEKALIEHALDDAYQAFLDGFDVVDYEEVKDKPLGSLFSAYKKKEQKEQESESFETGEEENGEE